jgi:hypothetical protein
MRFRSLFIAHTLSLLSYLTGLTSSNALEAAVRTPVNCSSGASCGFDISLPEVISSTEEYDSFVVNCKTRNQDPAKCIIPAAVFDNVCNEPRLYYYKWARIESIVDGKDVFSQLANRAKSGELFGEGLYRKVIVEVSGTPANEQHLALCNVNVVKDVAGPPSKCTTVVIVTQSATFVRGSFGSPLPKTSGYPVCYTSASVRVDSGIIDIKYNINTTHTIEQFANSLGEMLTNSLGLVVDTESKSSDGIIYDITFKSAAPLRESMILEGGWRESFAFDLQIGRDKKSIKVTGWSEPLICRLASGNLIDYQAPSDAQRGKYAHKLDTLVADALTKTYNTCKKIDSNNINCD